MLLVVVVLQLVYLNFWPRFPSPNERSRAYQAIAVATRGSLDISVELELFGAMEDVSAFSGKPYPNKAPGLLPLLVAPAWVATHLHASNRGQQLAWTLFLGRLLTSSLPFLATILLLAHITMGRADRGAMLTVTGFALASPALTASLLLFAHSLSAFLMLTAAYLLVIRKTRPTWPRLLLGGFLLGWLPLCEYPLAIPAAVIGVLALWRLGLYRTSVATAGGVVPIILLGLYNRVCFGSPFSFSSAHETSTQFVSLATQGIAGVSWPTWGGIGELLFSPARGLLIWLPLITIAVVGAIRVKPRWTATQVACWAPFIVLFLLMAGYPNRHGGWFAGPRYLIAALPLMFIPVADGLAWFADRFVGRLASYSMALWGWAASWLSIAPFPFPPPDYALPFVTFSLPALIDGVVFPSLLPVALRLPVAIVLAATAAFLLLRPMGFSSDRLTRVLAIALVLTLLVVLTPPKPSTMWQAQLEYAVVRDVYSGTKPRGALEALREVATTVVRRQHIEGWIATRDAPLPWRGGVPSSTSPAQQQPPS